jgi:hypothetical protein
MAEDRSKSPPRWLFSILAVGALVACGIYLGMIRVEGVSTGHVIRAAGFGVLGLLMLWGALGKRWAMSQDPQSYKNMRNATGLLKLVSQGEKSIESGKVKTQGEVFDNIERKLKKANGCHFDTSRIVEITK